MNVYRVASRPKQRRVFDLADGGAVAFRVVFGILLAVGGSYWAYSWFDGGGVVFVFAVILALFGALTALRTLYGRTWRVAFEVTGDSLKIVWLDDRKRAPRTLPIRTLRGVVGQQLTLRNRHGDETHHLLPSLDVVSETNGVSATQRELVPLTPSYVRKSAGERMVRELSAYVDALRAP